LFRPFSAKYFAEALPKSVKRIAVLDRAKEPGAGGEPLFLDIRSISTEKKMPLLLLADVMV
jgi:pyruvate-ferredoxin/flavodoxin oxidoreductase